MKIAPKLINFVKKSRNEKDEDDEKTLTSPSASLKSMFSCEESLKILPTITEFDSLAKNIHNKRVKIRMGCIFDHGDGAKWLNDPSKAPHGSNVVLGAIVHDPDFGPRFVPGECLEDDRLIPGQRMTSVNGEFIPGASIRGENGFFQFIPGVISDDDGGQFKAGQFVKRKDSDEVEFVKGQVVHTPKGSKFVEGETVSTADGIKFVAG